MDVNENKVGLIHTFKNSSKLNRIFFGVLIASILAGAGTGYFLASSNNANLSLNTPLVKTAPKTAGQDTRTFRDFAEGKIAKKEVKNTEEYVEGTHVLIRDSGTPVALTSSVVDLSKYEGKKVKVYGETQKAIKEGWLMDVGKVEEK